MPCHLYSLKPCILHMVCAAGPDKPKNKESVSDNDSRQMCPQDFTQTVSRCRQNVWDSTLSGLSVSVSNFPENKL